MLNICRRNFGWLALALFLAWSFGPSAQAQTAETNKKILTLDEAVDFALKHYPAVRASLERSTAAQAGVGLACAALAASASSPKKTADEPPQQPIEVSADKSLEWYQDQRLYVARGGAKAVRNGLVVEADLLTAHEREKSPGAALCCIRRVGYDAVVARGYHPHDLVHRRA